MARQKEIHGAADLQELFAEPTIPYRPAPLWVWNDELTPARVREQLRILQKGGMGAVYVHPRPGLISEYLGPEWWKCIAAAIDEAKKIGLELNIYDENSYPSGFAGGNVSAALPLSAARGVNLRELGPDEEVREPTVLTTKEVFASAEHEGKRYVVESAPANPMQWMGGFSYTDVTRPEVIEAFLRSTYEEYRRRHGREFGRTITTFFFDEPMMGNGTLYGAPTTLPFSRHLAAEFYRIKGYDLLPELPKLFLEMPGCEKVRFDYYEVIHGLIARNFVKPLQAWCRRHKLRLTGHYMEHTWLYPYRMGTPDAMALYEWIDMPGIDMLECWLLTDEVPKVLADTARVLLLTVREVLSAANQIGHRRTMCESFGAGGYDSTFEDYKRIGDWLYVHGINYLTPHLSFMTIRGARKRDHPQTFSEHSAWWPHFRPLADYFSRLSAVLSQGRMRQRILLFHPTTSGWIGANPLTQSEKVGTLFNTQTDLVQFLCDRLWDFDLGDEIIMANHGKVRGSTLQVGKQRYEVLVMPAHVTNICAKTLALLQDFSRRGGVIVSLGEAPKFVDGIPDERPKKLSKGWKRVKNLDALDVELEQKVGRQVRVHDGRAHAGLGVHRRELSDIRVCYFVTNASSSRVTTRLVPRESGDVERWDAATGKVAREPAGDLLVDLASAGSVLFVVNLRKNSPGIPNEGPRKLDVRSLDLLSVQRNSPNVLVLDYCDVEFDGRSRKGAHHWKANWEVTRAHGLDGRPPWDHVVQYRRTILDRDCFAKDSGFEAAYHFKVRSVPSVIALAVECPELYAIEVNGTEVSWRAGKRWIDPHIRATDIVRLIKTGMNSVRIVAHPYRIRMELEPVYLLGDFILHPEKKGFSIDRERDLKLGGWREIGMPFYGDAVTYTFIYTAHGRAQRLLSLPQWEGAVASITVNGRVAGMIGWRQTLSPRGGYEADISHRVRSGENIIGVTVVGTPKNFLGPFHSKSSDPTGFGIPVAVPPRRSGWAGLWHDAPQQGPPPGADYDGIDYGLFRPAEILEWRTQ